MKNQYAVDIQLINVADKGDLHYMADFPYGLALMTAYLRKQGINTIMLQYPTWKKKEYINAILENPAYLYGFQASSENYVEIQKLVTIIKKSNPNATIIYGGPFVVDLYVALLENDPNLDAIVLGEGEYTVEELITILKTGNPKWKLIPGLARLDEEEKVVQNQPHRPAIQDMDAMPFAARDGINEGDYDTEGFYMHDVRITTSRGCTSRCTFCAVNLNSRLQRAKIWRGRSPLNVVDEIQGLVEKYNVKMINLQDSAFDDPGTLGPKRNRIFCEEIIKRGLNISMKAYFRAHSIKDDPESIELYKLYKEAGIDVIIIGAEAGSDYELDLYGKTAKLEDNYRAFRIFNDLDLFFNHIGFIHYGPYSTIPNLRKNAHFVYTAQSFYWYHTIDSTLILTPGAKLHNTIRDEGRMLPRKNFWEFPDYEFASPEILKLAQHYTHLRTIYPHLDVGSPLVLKVANVISRLKNKMNKKILVECEAEVEEFRKVWKYNKNKLNELGYQGVMENLDRIEKDGMNADLIAGSKPYFGENWETCVYDLKAAYENFIITIQDSGFGTAGLIFDAELTAREQKTNLLEDMKFSRNSQKVNYVQV